MARPSSTIQEQILVTSTVCLSRLAREAKWDRARWRYFIVGITNSAPARMPVGQRVVMVFSFV